MFCAVEVLRRVGIKDWDVDIAMKIMHRVLGMQEKDGINVFFCLHIWKIH